MQSDSLASLFVNYLRERQELVDTLVVDGAALATLRAWATQPKVEQPAARPPWPKQTHRTVQKRLSPPKTTPTFSLEHEKLDYQREDARNDTTIQQALKHACPGLKILDIPPDDAIARQRSVAHAIVVLSLQDPVIHVALLRSLVRALQICVAPARLVELSRELIRDYRETLETSVPKLVVCTPAVAKELKGSQLNIHVIEELGEVIKKPRLKWNLWKLMIASWNKT